MHIYPSVSVNCRVSKISVCFSDIVSEYTVSKCIQWSEVLLQPVCDNELIRHLCRDKNEVTSNRGTRVRNRTTAPGSAEGQAGGTKNARGKKLKFWSVRDMKF